MPRQVGGYVRVGPRQTWAYSGSFTLLQGHHAKPVWMGDGLEGGQAGASAGMQWASVRAAYSTMLKPGPDYGWADIWGYQHGIPESAAAEDLWEELVAREAAKPDGFYVVHYVYEVWASVGFELPDLTPNPTQLLSLSYAAASFAFDYEHYGGEEDGSFWLVAPQDMALSWSVSVTNVALKRAWGTNVPDKRAHMHPRDAFLTDAWALTPESVATATIGGNTATATRRDAWTHGETDGEIGDQLIDGPYINYGCSQIGHASEGAEVARISVSGVDFTGLNNTTEVYPGGSWDDKVLAVGSDGGMALVVQEAVSATHSWGGQTFAPLMYSWDVSADLFHGEPLSPVWWAGKIEDGQPVPGLPSGVEPPQHGWQGTPIGGSTPPASPRGFNRGISIGLDPEWCLQQRLCPQSEVEYLDGLSIEEQHDRYVNLYGPGVQQGTTGGAIRIGSLNAVGKSCLPLVPGRSGNPERRWSLQGDITETAASTRALPEFLVEGVGELAYQPVTRMWDRLDLLPQTDDSDPPIPKDWAWPWRLRAQAEGQGLVSDPADPREPAWAEDVFHWGALAFVKLQLRRKLVDPPPDWEEEEPPDWDEATPPLTGKLVLAYSTIEVEDQHYTCGEWRAEEWDYTRSPATAEYTFTIGAEESVVNIDLLCPDFGEPPRLYVVDDVRLVELDAGEAPVTMRLAALELVRDPGVDHTGRAASPAPAMLASVKETWDFLPADGGSDQNRTGDWQGMSVAVDGNLRALEWPGDPWKNRGPERGRGYIEPLQHCPTYTGPAGLMHFARPIGDLGAAAQCEGIAASVDDTALARSVGADGEFEYLGGRVMYWGANQGWLNPYDDGSKGGLLASVNVTSHEIVRGIAYTICGRKSLGGAAWGLLRSTDGHRRILQGSVESADLQWVIWKRVVAYQDADGDDIETPSGAPARGQWEAVSNGPLDDLLDQHGVLRTPGLPPSRSRVWNPARGDNPADHTDTAETEYLLQLWAGAGQPWDGYDLNDEADWQTLLEDPALAAHAHFLTATRRLTTLSLRVPVSGDIQAVYTPWDTVMISHRAGLRWPADPGQRWAPDARSVSVPLPQAGLVVEGVSAWVHQGAWPWETTRVHEVGTRAAVTAQLDGQLLVVGEVAGELVLCRTTQSGRPARGESIVATLPGHTHPSLVLNMHRGTGLCLARRTEDGVCCAYEVCRTAPGREQEFVYRGTIAPCDPVCQGVVHTPEGHYLVALCYRGDIILYRSRNHGEDWEALG